MPRKTKHKSSKRDHNYSKISKKLSVVEKQIYYGCQKKIVYGMDAMQTHITKQALKIFYEYLEIELQKKDQTNVGLQAVYVFVDKCIFEAANINTGNIAYKLRIEINCVRYNRSYETLGEAIVER